MFYTEEMLAGSTLEDFTPFMEKEEEDDMDDTSSEQLDEDRHTSARYEASVVSYAEGR